MKRSIISAMGGIFALLILTGSGCMKEQVQGAKDLDGQLAKIINEHSLTGDPSKGRDPVKIDSSVAQLGMKLFFSKSLSLEGDTACVSCHHPFLGGGDNLPLPIGVEAVNADILGEGRTHPGGVFTVPRNSPTTFNAGLWKKALFFDGRVEVLGEKNGNMTIRTPDSDFGVADPKAGNSLLEAQARFPVTSVDEMRGRATEVMADIRKDRQQVRRRLVQRLAENNWTQEFKRAFPGYKEPKSLISYAHIAKAISAYEESQLFINNPWRSYVQGNTSAISQSAKRGALLFFKGVNQGGTGCAACHSGDFFSDENFYVLCIPQVGVGKGDGETGTDDFGRFRETGNPLDTHAFRTQSLLNVEVTGPYGHSGFYGSLEEVVRHHSSPAKAVARCNFEELDPMIPSKDAEKNTKDVLAHLQRNKDQGIATLTEFSLSDGQLTDIVNFLKSLTDPCVKDKECLKPWVLGPDMQGPDGSLLRAIDEQGRPL
ncbi:MAG: cytochrome c peroxidase [Thermodesulfobacteriota bacterium]